MDYIVTSDGELYHAAPNRGWEKEDHKYIKREWKNGHWQYTYPSDAKKSSTNARINNSKASKEYQAESEYNSKKNSYPTSMAGNSKTKNISSLKRGAEAIAKAMGETASKTAGKASIAKTMIGNKKIEAPETKRISSAFEKVAAAKKTIDEETKKTPSVSILRSAKQMVRGNYKVADAVNDYKVQTDKKAIADKAVDATRQKILSGKADRHAFAELRDVMQKAVDTRLSARKAGGGINSALKETAIERIFDEHKTYINDQWQKRINGETNDLRDTYRFWTRYNTEIERQIRNGTYVDPFAAEDEGEPYRRFDLDSAAKGVADWFGKPEAEALNEAEYRCYRSEERWRNANEEADRAKEMYDQWVDVTKKNASDNVEQLNYAYDRWKELDDYAMMEFSEYMVDRATYEKAAEAYMKTPAADLERRYDTFVESAGDLIDSGKDWLDDRLDDLEDWWDNLRR